MLIIAALSHIKSVAKRFVTRQQLKKLDSSRYDDIDMTLDEINQELKKMSMMNLLLDLLLLKRRL
ncbi:hypothetical protein O1D97_03220 [Marinomonas sp. 15G1-11]|uniref:Uncharacterized protein n=1 Tax=Marinomonas phaeophyticola TaxID=3004091 RepID=A0ABT4JQS2_9GAMM|nr:hypothetical protein [Marinomonas sp. 15G1-11]MCZ2720679.1 hypothetical protein [Marinomonas sp. 15G1-11]